MREITNRGEFTAEVERLVREITKSHEHERPDLLAAACLHIAAGVAAAAALEAGHPVDPIATEAAVTFVKIARAGYALEQLDRAPAAGSA